MYPLFKSQFAKNTLSFVSIFFLNSLWIHYLKSDFNNWLIIDQLALSHIQYQLNIYFTNAYWIHYLFHFQFTISSRIHYKSIIFVLSSIWIHHLFCEFTMTRQSVSQIIYYFPIFIAIIIHLKFTIWFLRSHHESITMFANSL